MPAAITGPCATAHNWPRATNPGPSKALTDREMVKIKIMGADLGPHLKTVDDLQLTNSLLRKKVSMILAAPTGTFFSRCSAMVSALFGVTQPGPEMLKRALQEEISENVSKLKRLVEGTIQPTIDEIRQQNHGRTFVRTSNTPKPLILAAIPTEKVGKIPNHIDLMIRIVNHIGSSENSGVRIIQSKIGERMVISRLNGNNEEELLEISYRRQGKVDVTVTSKTGVIATSVWNDDAERLATTFAAGQKFRFQPTRYPHYTVAEPTTSGRRE